MFIKNILDLFVLIVLAEVSGSCFANESPENLQELTVDIGGNLTLPCTDPETSIPLGNSEDVMWVRNGRLEEKISKSMIGPDGVLALTDLNKEDAGIYSCTLEGQSNSNAAKNEDSDIFRTQFKVEVRTPPPALVNVTVHPSTVLALLLWEVVDTGGYPITQFNAIYKQKYPSEDDKKSKDWVSVIPEHISPNVRQIDVYNLDPNTTYIFKIWANNQLGPGEVTVLEATTKHDMEEIELAKHLLQGAETFDTRVWVAAVAVVMGTLVMLAVGTCYLLYKECHLPSLRRDEQEVIELVPNIILNPGFYEDEARSERIEPDENSNDQTTSRINNNTVIHPVRV